VNGITEIWQHITGVQHDVNTPRKRRRRDADIQSAAAAAARRSVTIGGGGVIKMSAARRRRRTALEFNGSTCYRLCYYELVQIWSREDNQRCSDLLLNSRTDGPPSRDLICSAGTRCGRACGCVAIPGMKCTIA